MSQTSEADQIGGAILALILIALIGMANAGYKALTADLKFGLQELNITCTGQKGEATLTCEPGHINGGEGTACITWPSAFKASHGNAAITSCTSKGKTEKLSVAEEAERYTITVAGRTGEVYKSAFYPEE